MFIFCAVQDDLDFEFDPVSEPSDQERADLAKCGTDNIVTAYNAGLISQRTALREMKQQSSRTGTWTNITDEEIMNASDEIEPQGEMGGFPGMGGEEDGAGGPDLPHAGRGGEVGDKPPRHPESCHRLQDPSGIAIGKKTNTRVMEMASLLLAAVEERKMIHQERKKPRSILKKKGTKIRLVKRYSENTMDMKLLRN